MTDNPLIIILINTVVGILWQLIAFVLCVKLNVKWFDHRRRRYKIHKWEKNGLFYEKYFKIKLWKDHLPQFIAKDGFSKKSLDIKNMSDEYFDLFFLELCRAEWEHTFGCVYVFIYFFISPTVYAIIFSLLAIIINLMFAMIQRYNRARLLNVKEKLDKRKQRLAKKQVQSKNKLCEEKS